MTTTDDFAVVTTSGFCAMTANPDRHARSDTDPAPDPSGIEDDGYVPSPDGSSSTHDLDQRLKAFFDVAIEMPGDERAEFLNRSCTDPKLRAEVESLVLAHELCEKSFSNVGTESFAEQPGQLIGNYKLLQEIGAGGFGVVWMAEQLEPVRRKVALKILKLGMDTRQVVARFEAERQALALMDHPNIAKIFDGGATERGRPFFGMELVRGVPITRYCDEAGLSLRERLQLFLPVCQAVQHAHAKGIIHRDLKPGNVLVTLHDGTPVPKVIDFGVAKATHRELTAKTLFTEFRQLLGTPEYMAPEQAELSGLDVDTRADIYSLGVLLYELLTGRRPFEMQDAVHAGCEELLRRIKEEDPPKPSTRTSTLGKELGEVAKTRRVHPKALSKLLRNDLDWMVMKALEKDRGRRYETASSFAEDVRRYLDDRPVQAGPPGSLYQLAKYLRRHRVGAAAVAAVLASLTTGLGAAVLSYADARDNEQLAVAAAREADDQKAKAQASEKQAQRNLDKFLLLSNVLELADAKAEEAKLYPAFPAKAQAMRDWLWERGEPLAARLPGLEQALAELRAKAKPWTAARETHPRFAELQQREAALAAAERAFEVRTKNTPVMVPELETATKVKTAQQLNELAWPLVDTEKPVYGREREALAMARLALAKIDNGDASLQRHTLLDTLAWACYRNGLDEEAVQHSKAAHASCKPEQQREYAGYTEKLEQAIGSWLGDSGVQKLRRLQELATALDAEVSARREYTFEDGGDRFLHQTLSRLVVDMRAFIGKKGEFGAVQQRLAEAETVQARTIDAYRPQWNDAVAGIAKSDDVVASKSYENFVLTPQLGLVPLGMDPESKLWEFVHLASGTPGKEVPGRDKETRRLIPTGDMGLVFVLLPGGTFTMGAQKESRDLPNYDPQAEENQTPHLVTLSPFFLSKYEMTQGQWARLWRWDESLRWPSQYRVGGDYRGIPVRIGASHPVESVSWEMCDELLRRSGLELPTEAQWEYGCRATTTTPWYTGEEATTLHEHGNVLDQYAVREYPSWGTAQAFADGFAGPASVGRYFPNAFGLYDVHGNVWEWCRDLYGTYRVEGRAGDGLRLERDGSSDRVLRGGSFRLPAADARSAIRPRRAPTFRISDIGCRPARTWRP